jgi:peptide deformylase
MPKKPPAIVQEGHAALRAVAKPVAKKEFGSPELLALVEKMRAALATREDGIAIAAPQIGVGKRVFVLAPRAADLFKGEPAMVFVNPEILRRSRDRKLVEEGCLSVPGRYGKIRRASRAAIHAHDEHGNGFVAEGAGLLAQIFQHETDHLDGKLFVDDAKETYPAPNAK